MDINLFGVDDEDDEDQSGAFGGSAFAFGNDNNSNNLSFRCIIMCIRRNLSSTPNNRCFQVSKNVELSGVLALKALRMNADMQASRASPIHYTVFFKVYFHEMNLMMVVILHENIGLLHQLFQLGSFS